MASLRKVHLLLGLLLGHEALAQVFVPVTITHDPGATPEQVRFSWPTIPGKFYDLQTRDGLDAPWVMTNLPPVRARTTIGTAADSTSDTNVARFYRVRERVVPTGNTGAIAATTVAELEKVLGLTFTASQRSQLVGTLNAHRASFEAMRKNRLLNSDPPPLIFNPIPMGATLEATQRPISWSPPKNVVVPANRADLAFYTVRDLGELIRTRQLTSMELTQLYLERLKRHDTRLRCVITLTEELALRQAARADQELAAGRYRGPLHGIPYGIKDLFAVRGYRTTWGAAPFKDQVIDEDATVFRKLDEAGAVLLAKLSTGELAVNDTWFGGQTRNPWDVNQGSSGSSAGSASATSAGLVAFAIGTETWGSIVSPATVCRVTGLRSTFGRVSRAGAMSLSWSMDKVGPLCRSVEDCALVLDAIRGPDLIDQAVVDAPFNYSASADLTKLRVGYRSGQLSAAVLNRLSAIVGPAQLVKVTLPTNPIDTLLVLDAEAAAAFDELTRFGADAFLTVQGIWPAEFRAGRTIPAVEYLQANRQRQKLIQSMHGVMQTVDVYVATDAEAVNGETSAITNLTGQPCVVIPHGSGTSLGFVGRPFEEATILALAKAYQDATSFHTNRPPAFIK